jgi:hypothetical protein
MTPEQRERFCEQNEVLVGPSYCQRGKVIGWYAYHNGKAVQAFAAKRTEAIEMLAKMMEMMK